MAADKTLVEGAYRAASAGQDEGMAWARSMAKLVEDSKTWDLKKKKKKEEDKQLANEVVNDGGELPKGEIETQTDDLTNGQEEYVNGDETQKMVSIQQQNLQKEDASQYKEIRYNLAANYDDLSNQFTDVTNETGSEILGLLTSEAHMVTMGSEEFPCADPDNCPSKGRKGVIIGGEWKSMSALQDMIKLKDKKSATAIKSFGFKYMQQGKNGGDFDRTVASQLISSNIMEQGDVLSIAMDPMFDKDRTYFSDTVNEMMNYSYADLGLDDESLMKYAQSQGMEELLNDGLDDEERQAIKDHHTSNQREFFQKQEDNQAIYAPYIEALKVDTSDGISKMEAEGILRNMMNDPNNVTHFKSELNNYLTNFAENQYNKGVNDKKKADAHEIKMAKEAEEKKQELLKIKNNNKDENNQLIPQTVIDKNIEIVKKDYSKEK